MSTKKKLNAKQDGVYAKDSSASMPTNVSPHPIGTRRKATFIRNALIIRPKDLISASFYFSVPAQAACCFVRLSANAYHLNVFTKFLSEFVENT